MSDQNGSQQFLSPGRHAGTIVPDGSPPSVQRQSQQLEEFVAGVSGQLRAVRRDRNLTETGKRDRRREILASAEDSIGRAALDSDIQRAKENVTKAEEHIRGLLEFQTRRTDGDATEFHLQVRETRELQRRMVEAGKAIDVKVMAREAVGAKDSVFLRALVTAPRAFPVLPEADMTELKDFWAESHEPGAVETLNQRRSVLSTMQFNRSAAVSQLRSLP